MMHTRHMGDDAVEMRTYMFVAVVSSFQTADVLVVSCFQDRRSLFAFRFFGGVAASSAAADL